jgi:MurNAc alpha-1-phosphate uridylyltransferase
MSGPAIAILAGGLATRLGELTAHVPKSLLEVCGRPFLAWQLELLARHGLSEVVLCVSHHATQIEDWLPGNTPPGMRVRLSYDGERRLGTGGALLRALSLLGESFLVTYGDSYLLCDYLAIYRHFEAQQALSKRPLGLMTVFANDNRWDTSNVIYRNGAIVRYDKRNRVPEMHHIDWGLGVLTREALAAYPAEQPLDLADVYTALVAREQLAGYEVRQRFYEVGSHAGLAEFRAYIATHDCSKSWP